jgi:beta-N-acetylhexosaminidase
MAAGLMAGGVMPVGKHAPGHGQAGVDSHVALPRVDGDDREADLLPFAANADLPWFMTAHIVYPAFDPISPATLSRPVIERIIRGRMGYRGLLVTDDLAMQALTGLPAERARAALAAGCDIALYCAGEPDANAAILATAATLHPDAVARLAAARAAVRQRWLPLDGSALAAERDRLLA